MAASNKTTLREITVKEFEKLNKLISPLSADDAAAIHDESTIKDVIGHRAHWMTLYLGWYTDGQADKEVFFPAKGYKWNDLKRYNANLREQQSNMTWADVQKLLHDNYAKLLAFIDEKDDDALYGGPMKGANNNWTAGRWAEAAGPSHFRSAAKYIRAALKAKQPA